MTVHLAGHDTMQQPLTQERKRASRKSQLKMGRVLPVQKYFLAKQSGECLVACWQPA
jgi:hypothetical protein